MLRVKIILSVAGLLVICCGQSGTNQTISGVITATGGNADNSPQTLSIAISNMKVQSTRRDTLPVSFVNPNLGHFVFQDGTGNAITSLQLQSGQKGTISLKNTGGGAIGSAGGPVLVTIPDNLKTYFSGSCLSAVMLPVGGACSLDYSI